MIAALRISFIVPVYEVREFLNECVHSIVSASIEGDQIILVDDGSTDGSGPRCDDWRQRHPDLIEVLHQVNQGLSAARNHGLARARCPYVVFMDSDDAVVPDSFAAIRQRLASAQPDILVCDFIWWHPTRPERTQRSEPLSHSVDTVLTDAVGFGIDSLEDFLLSACSRVYSRELLKRLGNAPFPIGKAYEELATVPRLIARARTLMYLPIPMFKYRMREGSITHTPTARHCRDRCAALATFVGELSADRKPESLQLAAHRRLAYLMTIAIRDCGQLQPQMPALYAELVRAGFACFRIPVPQVVASLRASSKGELRRVANHLHRAWRSPALYVMARRVASAWRRRHLARRARAEGA